ncbi:Rhophilin-2 [Nymphon striatum]|nr:Rhophilin-2 [Nymphon striatum]
MVARFCFIIILTEGVKMSEIVTKDKKMKENVGLELSFVNSNLQLLKEELAQLNSSVGVYQDIRITELVPMIPLGLKETKDIDFKEPFKDFILEHYSENGSLHENAINELNEIRKAVKTPLRDGSGVRLLFEYYNYLYFVERRFFPPNRNLGIFFEWFDSLTGIPSCQRSVAFEKASILFNIAALYTQMGVKQNRKTQSGSDTAVNNFLRAAGMFQYILESFTKAPSMDLDVKTLDMLTNLMLAQARECIYERLVGSISSIEKQGLSVCIEIAQEAAEVAKFYNTVLKAVSFRPVKDYVPYTWISLIQVKIEHYRAMAHHFTAIGLIEHTGDMTESLRQSLEFLHVTNENSSLLIDFAIPETSEECKLLAKSHLREALLLHEEALRLHRMCKQLRKVDNLQEILSTAHDTSLNKYADIEDEDDFQEVFDPPQIQPSTKYQLTLTNPDFSHYRVQDLFANLGPISIFCAKNNWTAPRTVKLCKNDKNEFGFSFRGNTPVIIVATDIGSIAENAGIKVGDLIVKVGEEDTKWSTHEEVHSLIKACDGNLFLKLVTPMNRNYLDPKGSPGGTNSISGSSGFSSGSNSSNESPTGSLSSNKSKDGTPTRKKLSWNIFKKSKENDKSASEFDCNIILKTKTP